MWGSDVRQRLVVCGVLALLGVLFVSATRAWNPRSRGRSASFPPRVVSGDEPHYLLTTNALLRGDGFSVRAGYARVRGGSTEAGLRFAGRSLDHHTLLLAPGLSSPERWQEAYQFSKPRPCPSPECTPFTPTSVDFDALPGVREVPAHPFAFPLLVAALLRPFGLEPDRVETVAITWNAVLAWLATVAIYGAARASGFSRPSALAVALVSGLASPLLAYGRGFFPEAAIGCTLAVAAWLFFRGRLALSGAACAVAFALKPPFALAGAGLVADRLLARQWREALRLGAPLAGGVAVVLGMNQLVARTPLISGMSGWVWARGLDGLRSTLLESTSGLLPFVPWAAVSLGAAVLGVVRPVAPGAPPRPGRALGLGVLATLVLLALHGEGAGDCWGPRYWVGWCPWLALLAVDFARRGGRLRVIAVGVLVAWAVPISLAGAFRYPAVWNRTPIETVRAQWRSFPW